MSAVPRALSIATVFGTSSPSTTCRKVISANAKPIATEWTATGLPIPTAAKAGSRRRAKAGSPTQPRPREVSVIPSWQAER